MSNKPTITVFTPSYNRAYILPKLYVSLCNQTCKDFEWVVVNDGSSDNTEDLLKHWDSEKRIPMKWITQKNQGKHIAINTGVSIASGELFFIVDSDDTLDQNAIETLINHWLSISNDASLSGVISYRKFPNGAIVGNKLPARVNRCKLRDCNKLYGSYGDKVVAYRTSILKLHPYPKYGNERFLGESYLFNIIDDAYDMSVLDATFYRFDYQKDGLSQNFRSLYRKNPRGFLALYEQEYKYCRAWSRVKILSHVVCLCLRLHVIPKLSFNILDMIVALPVGIILYIKIFALKANDVKPYTKFTNEND